MKASEEAILIERYGNVQDLEWPSMIGLGPDYDDLDLGWVVCW